MYDGKVQVNFGGLFQKKQDRILVLGNRNLTLYKTEEKKKNEPSEIYPYHSFTPYEGEEKGNSFYILTKKNERIDFTTENNDKKTYIFVKLKSLHYSFISKYYLSETYKKLEKSIDASSSTANDYNILQSSTMLLFPQLIKDFKKVMLELKPLIDKKTHLKDVYMDIYLKFSSIAKEMELRFGNISTLCRQLFKNQIDSKDMLNSTVDNIDFPNLEEIQMDNYPRRNSVKSNFHRVNALKINNIEKENKNYKKVLEENKNDSFQLFQTNFSFMSLTKTNKEVPVLCMEKMLNCQLFGKKKIIQKFEIEDIHVFSICGTEKPKKFENLKKEAAHCNKYLPTKKIKEFFISNSFTNYLPQIKIKPNHQICFNEKLDFLNILPKSIILEIIEQNKIEFSPNYRKIFKFLDFQENSFSFFTNKKKQQNFITTKESNLAIVQRKSQKINEIISESIFNILKEKKNSSLNVSNENMISIINKNKTYNNSIIQESFLSILNKNKKINYIRNENTICIFSKKEKPIYSIIIVNSESIINNEKHKFKNCCTEQNFWSIINKNKDDILYIINEKELSIEKIHKKEIKEINHETSLFIRRNKRDNKYSIFNENNICILNNHIKHHNYSFVNQNEFTIESLIRNKTFEVYQGNNIYIYSNIRRNGRLYSTVPSGFSYFKAKKSISYQISLDKSFTLINEIKKNIFEIINENSMSLIEKREITPSTQSESRASQCSLGEEEIKDKKIYQVERTENISRIGNLRDERFDEVKLEYSNKPKKNFFHPLYSMITPRKCFKYELAIPCNFGQYLLTKVLSIKSENIPISYSEPLTTLQRQSEKFQFSYLLKKATLLYSKYTKELPLCYIAAFLISEMSLNLNRYLMQITPSQNETYEYYNNELKYYYFAEQVCSFPPISAYISESKYFQYSSDSNFEYKYNILSNSLDFHEKTTRNLVLKGEKVKTYIYKMPILQIKNLPFGKPYFTYHGETEIKCIGNNEKKKEKCIIKFTDDKAGAFQGIVVDKNNKIQYNLRGSWKKNIEMKYINEDRWKTLWEIDSSEKYLENGISLKSTRKYYLPRFSYELNNGRGVLRNYLRDTDSRLRKDIIEYEEGNLQNSQKINEKLVEENNSMLNPIYFERKEDKFGNVYHFLQK